ncbi:aminoglycoside phosphotransferase family protein [Caulobacter segnis]|nr:aminoglycoside phosphotransferase family protein [Caulobacter segnis]MDG2520605.1 aminoglycoside phosphotransferase family protein [Caulobacter segnis]
MRPLHGDLHHDNVLDFQERGGSPSILMASSASEDSTSPTSSPIPISPISSPRLRPGRTGSMRGNRLGPAAAI